MADVKDLVKELEGLVGTLETKVVNDKIEGLKTKLAELDESDEEAVAKVRNEFEELKATLKKEQDDKSSLAIFDEIEAMVSQTEIEFAEATKRYEDEGIEAGKSQKEDLQSDIDKIKAEIKEARKAGDMKLAGKLLGQMRELQTKMAGYKKYKKAEKKEEGKKPKETKADSETGKLLTDLRTELDEYKVRTEKAELALEDSKREVTLAQRISEFEGLGLFVEETKEKEMGFLKVASEEAYSFHKESLLGIKKAAQEESKTALDTLDLNSLEINRINIAEASASQKYTDDLDLLYGKEEKE